MSKAQLRLGRLDIRIARSDRAGHDSAPVGTRVWLDVPGSSFRFQEFVVVADRKNSKLRRLARPKTAKKRQVRLDLASNYWCVWGKAGSKISLKGKLDPYTRVEGFGYPLQAWTTVRQKSGERCLVLPNTRRVRIREFNLSGIPTSNERITLLKDYTKRMYDGVHIEFDYQSQPRPSGMPDLIVHGIRGAKKKPMTFHDRKHLRRLPKMKDAQKRALKAVSLPVGSKPWNPGSNELFNTVILVWIRALEVEHSGVTAFATGSAPLLNSMRVDISNDAFPKTRIPCPVVVCPVEIRSDLGGFTTLPEYTLAHELGHVMLWDLGLGRNNISQMDKQVGGYRKKVDEALDSLRLRIPKPYDKLTRTDHHRSPKNLMTAIHGTAKGPLKELDALQVALMRKNPVLRWKKTQKLLAPVASDLPKGVR